MSMRQEWIRVVSLVGPGDTAWEGKEGGERQGRGGRQGSKRDWRQNKKSVSEQRHEQSRGKLGGATWRAARGCNTWRADTWRADTRRVEWKSLGAIQVAGDHWGCSAIGIFLTRKWDGIPQRMFGDLRIRLEGKQRDRDPMSLLSLPTTYVQDG